MSPNMFTLLNVAAELRSGGMPWEGVANKLHRKPNTCAKWPSRYRHVWEKVYHEAQQKRYEDAGNEALTFLRNWMRGKDPRWSIKAIEVLFKCGPKPTPMEQSPIPKTPMDESIQRMARLAPVERERMDRVRAHEGKPPLTDAEFWDQWRAELREILDDEPVEASEEENQLAGSGEEPPHPGPLPRSGGEGEDPVVAQYMDGEGEHSYSLSPASGTRAGVRGSSDDPASQTRVGVRGLSDDPASGNGLANQPGSASDLNLLRILLLLIGTLTLGIFAGRASDRAPGHEAAPVVSSDGLASHSRPRFASGSDYVVRFPFEIEVHDVKDGTLLDKFGSWWESPMFLAFAPDGALLVGGINREAEVVNAAIRSRFPAVVRPARISPCLLAFWEKAIRERCRAPSADDQHDQLTSSAVVDQAEWDEIPRAPRPSRSDASQRFAGVAELGQSKPHAVHERQVQSAQLPSVVARLQVVERAAGLQRSAK